MATSFNNLASLRFAGKVRSSRTSVFSSSGVKKQLLGDNHPDVASSLNNLAGLYYTQGRYEAAEPLFLQALELYKQLLGENHPDYAQNLNNLAGTT